MSSFASPRISFLLNVRFYKWCFGFASLIIVQISVLKYFWLIFIPNVIVQPDLVLILLFFFGIRQSQITSTLTGFFAGFFLDAFGGGIIGLHALTKTFAGFLIGYVPKAHKLQRIIQFCVFYFIINIIHDILYKLIYTINTEFNIWKLLFVQSLPSTIYSLFIGAIFFYCLTK